MANYYSSNANAYQGTSSGTGGANNPYNANNPYANTNTNNPSNNTNSTENNANVNANANANANVDVNVNVNTGDQEQSVLKELSESTAGLYLIFIPFIPCLFWSLVVRNNSKKRLSNDNGGTDTGTGNSSKRKED